MAQKRRKKPRRSPVRMRITNVKGDPQKYAEMYAEADKHAILGEFQLAAGVFQHPHTGLWQVWSSTAGRDVSWLAAYRDQGRAEQAVEAYKQFCMTEACYNPEACAAFFQTLIDSSDAEPENASAADIANITRRIGEATFETYKREEHD